MVRIALAAALLCALVWLGACSDDTDTEAQPAPTTATTTADSDTSGPTEPTPAPTPDPNAPTPLPGRPSEQNTGTPDENLMWLGRVEMTDTYVELTWSPVEDVVTYQLHRIARDATEQPENYSVDDTTLIYQGTEVGLTDEQVETGASYWYILIATRDTGEPFRRSSPAYAVTDTEPPAKVTNVNASAADGAVTLTWDQSSDNYQFARYAIRRSVDGAQSVYYGTGWSIDQTSFVDDQLPPAGSSVTYELIAMDVHENTSEPTLISVSL